MPVPMESSIDEQIVSSDCTFTLSKKLRKYNPEKTAAAVEELIALALRYGAMTYHVVIAPVGMYHEKVSVHVEMPHNVLPQSD